MNKKRIYLWVCVFFAAVAVFIRMFRFGAAPGGFNQDEAMASYDAYALAMYGTDRFGMFMPVHFTAWGYGQMSVLMSYAMTPFIKIFGLSVWVARLPVLIVSLCGIYVLFRLIRDIFGDYAALAVLAFCAINPWHIMQSRWALDCNMFPHFFLFGVYFLYNGLRRDTGGGIGDTNRGDTGSNTSRAAGSDQHPAASLNASRAAGDKPRQTVATNASRAAGGVLRRFADSAIFLAVRRNWRLPMSMLCFALCMYTYGIAFYTVPLFLVVASAYLLKTRMVTLREFVICVGVYLLVAWPIFGVMAINYLRLPSINTRFFTIPFFPDSVRTGDLLFFSDEPLRQLARNAKSLVDVVFHQQDNLPWNIITNFGSVYLFSFPFAYAGVWSCVIHWKREQKNVSARKNTTARAGMTLSAIWLGVALFSGLVVNGINTNRINIVFYPLIILMGLGVWHIMECLAQLKPNKKVIISTALILAYALSFAAFSRSYFGEHNRYLSGMFYEGWDKSVAYAVTGGDTSIPKSQQPTDISDVEPDTLYITAYSQYPGAYTVSEIITLFAAKVDPRYLNSQDYYEKFRYVRFTGPDEGYDGYYEFNPVERIASDRAGYMRSAFVFNADYERYLFPDSMFNVVIFDGYGCATLK